MRIIGGTHKGRTIRTPKDLPVRPTTDFAKEGLFNILGNRIDFDGIDVLDLFSGTGNISLEFASRGARQVVAVEKNFKCAGFLRAEAQNLKLPVMVVKDDVFSFLKNNSSKFQLIFADPPYDLKEIEKIPALILAKNSLLPGGLLIIEHGASTHFDTEPGFKEHRKYGNVNFSFFSGPDE